MQYSFNEWVDGKEQPLNEWNPFAGWFGGQKPKRAGRQLGPVGSPELWQAMNAPQDQQQGYIDRWRAQGDASRQRAAQLQQQGNDARARLNAQHDQMRNQPVPQRQAQPQQPQQAAQKKTVGFNRSDLNKLKESLVGYIQVIGQYMDFLSKNVAYKGFIERASKALEATVGPYFEELRTWITWIDQMNAMVRESEELFIEAIQVSYKKFEKMRDAVQNLNMNMTKWVQEISKRLPPQQAQRIQTVYKDHVMARLVGLAKQVRWLDNKIQQLFQAHGQGYGGLGAKGLEPSAQPSYRQGHQGIRDPFAAHPLQRTYAT